MTRRWARLTITNGYILNSRKTQMTKKIMKDIDIEISDIVEPNIDIAKSDIPEEKLMTTLGAIDWKLWEILKILQKFDEDEQEESDD